MFLTRLTRLLRRVRARREDEATSGVGDAAARERDAASGGVEEDDDFDPFNPFPEPVRVPLTDVLDLHTVAPREVKRVVESYLEEAREAGFPGVRIIHGKGVGVQRELVRTVLARTPFVESFAD
ncbi:MAG TPA: Smr/MutS family protein, partial [Pyrinomonadaceae bacterium]|nr:Smr/MutS family protein [Pyrinomonadaceae bacterium]